MELSSQIKKYRTEMNLSQEELAEKIYVSRQTISNWENEKNYPDIHSLLDLSSLFGISLDQLIKGDIEIMREEINQVEREKFNRNGKIYACLLALFIFSFAPMVVFFWPWGLIISVGIYVAALYYALKLEKCKKKYDVRTYQEIIAFTEGKRLDEIAKARESGKRPYQNIMALIVCGAIMFAVSVFFVWFLKTFIV